MGNGQFNALAFFQVEAYQGRRAKTREVELPEFLQRLDLAISRLRGGFVEVEVLAERLTPRHKGNTYRVVQTFVHNNPEKGERFPVAHSHLFKPNGLTAEYYVVLAINGLGEDVRERGHYIQRAGNRLLVS